MSRTIAAIGSTGQQGGAVARACLQAGDWKVRGITRNVQSRGAQAMAAEGAEMVTADIDDHDALIKAFKGVHALFCVTDFWQHLGLGADAAGRKEAEQAFNIAHAASKTSTLEHYIFSTLPNATRLSGGQRPVAHMDQKSGVDDRIREELSDLARKTTFMWLGWYSANMAFFPVIRPFELPLSGKWLWMQPSKADALLPICGDVGANVGAYALAALNNPERARGKYVNVRTDRLSFSHIIGIWSEVSGKDAEYVSVSAETFEKLWGPAGREMALQYASGEMWDDWDTQRPGEMCTPEDLRIKPGELVDLKGNLTNLKSKLLSG
ncbi:hypothetical protein LTR36_010102 [Oleoguttula mirabilis]|uniref:NmrA-like domain-containing protein n=1 Tax=Oleoguttula mirabilis TaxID=1507867 RepID=A0AAV9JRS9_9PEZI|nr:hypothetical protein LTR36_010102 [Oleoguttula mirabilis]